MILVDFHIGIHQAWNTVYLTPPHPTGWSCPALSGDARTGDVKLILHYVINCIADSSILSLRQPPPPLLLIHPALLSSLLSVTVTLQLILSSNTPTEVLFPPVISYQVWLHSLWSCVSILAHSWLPLFSKWETTCTNITKVWACINASCNKCTKYFKKCVHAIESMQIVHQKSFS